jgi:hypothetical protein
MPDQKGSSVVSVSEFTPTLEFLRSCPQVLNAIADPSKVKRGAGSIVPESKLQARGVDRDRDVSAIRRRMANHVRETFAKSGEEVLGGFSADSLVERTLEGHRDLDPESISDLVAEVENLPADGAPGCVIWPADGEDRGSDLSDGAVEILDGLGDPRVNLFTGLETPCCLKRQTDGEEALDDGVVEISSHAIALFGQCVGFGLDLHPSLVDEEASGTTKGVSESLVLFGELCAGDLVAQIEVAVDGTSFKPNGNAEETRHRRVVFGKSCT